MARGKSPRRYPRTARVNEVVREALAEEIEVLSDPRLGFITLTGVNVVADLRSATVFYSVIGTEEEKAQTAAGLAAASKHLRVALGREVKLKYSPELTFTEDTGVVAGRRIETVIRGLHDEPEPPEPPTPKP